MKQLVRIWLILGVVLVLIWLMAGTPLLNPALGNYPYLKSKMEAEFLFGGIFITGWFLLLLLIKIGVNPRVVQKLK